MVKILIYCYDFNHIRNYLNSFIQSNDLYIICNTYFNTSIELNIDYNFLFTKDIDLILSSLKTINPDIILDLTFLSLTNDKYENLQNTSFYSQTILNLQKLLVFKNYYIYIDNIKNHPVYYVILNLVNNNNANILSISDSNLTIKPIFSIVMTYKNRLNQLYNTLDDFKNKYNKYLFEVIIVDDKSNKEESLDKSLINKYKLNIKLVKIEENEFNKFIVNPSYAYNEAFKHINGSIVIIQNAEVLHVGDLLEYIQNNLTDDKYITFSCFNPNSFELTHELLNETDKFKKVMNVEFLSRNVTDKATQINWLNCPFSNEHNGRQKKYHYCSAITYENLKKINGFDDRFYYGQCFDDDEFLYRIEHQLKLKTEIVSQSNGFTIHQYHKKEHLFNEKLWLKNHFLFTTVKFETYLKDIKKEKRYREIVNFLLEHRIFKQYDLNSEFIKNELDNFLTPTNCTFLADYFNCLYNSEVIEYIHKIPKIAFTYWDMSNLSFLHYLTIYTFKKYNPDWELVLYFPKDRVKSKSWKSFENKADLSSSYNYINDMKRIKGVTFIEIDFKKYMNKIPYFLSEVIKSDLFRVHVINEVGGVWIDMDTFWINSLNKFICYNQSLNYFNSINMLNIEYNNETVSWKEFKGTETFEENYFVVCNSEQENNNRNHAHFCQYILISSNNSMLFKKIEEKFMEYLNIEEYESIGTPLFSRILSKEMINCNKYNWNRNIINISTFAPYKWFEMDKLFFMSQETKEITNSACIHWFNGSISSKQFINDFNHLSLKNELPNTNFFKILSQVLDKNDINFLSTSLYRKISIAIAYYNRKEQLLFTLDSINSSFYKNIEIIIVDDASNNENMLYEQELHLINKNIKLYRIEPEFKKHINPCIPYNLAFSKCTGEIIIIQNPEVLHVGDCISTIYTHLEMNDWLSFNCYGSPSLNYNNQIKKQSFNDIFNSICLKTKIGGNTIENDNVGGWLNHYDTHFVAYHYLGAIYKHDLMTKMKKGFDEEFKDGLCLEDDDFIKRLIFNKFNLKISSFNCNTPFCIHLWHEKNTLLNNKNYYTVNRDIFNKKSIDMGFLPENNIHIIPENEKPIYYRVLI